MKVLFINLKKNIIPIMFLLFTICLIIFSKSNIQAVKNSLNIWFNNVIPSLFPFFIATEILYKTNFKFILGKLFSKISKPLFNVPGQATCALILGMISGYPIGAKMVVNLKRDKLITSSEAERLIAYTNNSGPLFIISSVRNQYV